MEKHIISIRSLKMTLSRLSKETDLRFTKNVNKDISRLPFNEIKAFPNIFYYIINTVDDFAIYNDEKLYMLCFNIMKNIFWAEFFTNILYSNDFKEMLKLYNIKVEHVENIKSTLKVIYSASEKHDISFFIAVSMLGEYDKRFLKCHSDLVEVEEKYINKCMML